MGTFTVSYVVPSFNHPHSPFKVNQPSACALNKGYHEPTTITIPAQSVASRMEEETLQLVGEVFKKVSWEVQTGSNIRNGRVRYEIPGTTYWIGQGYGLGEAPFRIPEREFSHLQKKPRLAVRPTQPPIQRVGGSVPRSKNGQSVKTDHLPIGVPRVFYWQGREGGGGADPEDI